MSPLVFQTKKDGGESFELAGAGVAGANGKGGIPVERAAQVVSQLQEKKADGSLKLDKSGQPVPLKGNALNGAAKALAKDAGVEVNDVSEKAIAKFPEDLGAAPDRPPLEQVSKDIYAKQTAGLEVVNDNPDELVQPAASAEGGDQ